MAEWQKGTGWEEWFEITGADGVDFYPIGQDPRKTPAVVLQSNTKEDILERKVGYPKSDYSFWKKINGKKYYISLGTPVEITHKVNVTAEVNYVLVISEADITMETLNYLTKIIKPFEKIHWLSCWRIKTYMKIGHSKWMITKLTISVIFGKCTLPIRAN